MGETEPNTANEPNGEDAAVAGGGTSRATVHIALACVIVGILLAVALVLAADRMFASGAMTDAHLQTVLAFGATWVPMVAAVGVFVLARRRRGAQAVLGIRFRWIDVLWGAAIGILARFVATGMSLLLYGTTGLVGQPTIGAVDGWYVFAALLAPVIIAPLIEEGFFRGLMQGALVRWFAGGIHASSGTAPPEPRGAGTAAVFGVGLSALVFVAVHLIGVPSTADALAIGVPLLVFAVAAGSARVITGRIGPAVIGHVVFNAVAVLLTWPWS